MIAARRTFSIVRMRLVSAVAVVVIAAAAAACSAPPGAPAPPSNRPAGAPDRTERALDLLRQLAAALRADRPIAPLVDAKDGAWLWDQPGAAVTPSIHVAAADGRRPSEILAASGWNDAMREGWAPAVAGEIERGLGLLDVDGDPRSPVYFVDCGSPDMPPARRALLLTRGIDLARDYAATLADAPEVDTTTPLGFAFRSSSIAVYLSERGGALAVAHIQWWTPCEA